MIYSSDKQLLAPKLFLIRGRAQSTFIIFKELLKRNDTSTSSF